MMIMSSLIWQKIHSTRFIFVDHSESLKESTYKELRTETTAQFGATFLTSPQVFAIYLNTLGSLRF